MSIRELSEEREEFLSPYATRSRLSKGRRQPEEPCSIRTAFQRDRDRIIHSMSFRRLKHKTQVFLAPVGDHFVTRLTHTLEVAQIARTVARALNLNEDLTEAIALGHDLGHTPFGHVGEEVLAELFPGGFRHNEQSLRVVDVLEREGQGLNLTWEVRDGILNHSKARASILAQGWDTVATLEAQICKIADSVAYINHDLEDALRAGVLRKEDLPGCVVGVLGQNHSQRINTLVCDIVEHSWAARGESSGIDSGDGRGPVEIGMSPDVLAAADTLREFLFQRVYLDQSPHSDAERARQLLRSLYGHFTAHPDGLPVDYLRRGDPLERAVVDHIASMTDRYALQVFVELNLPRLWPVVGPSGVWSVV